MQFNIDHTESPYHILVVDDEPIQRTLQHEILNQFGHKVDEASNGQEALALVKKNDYDVILMDKIMPVMDGDQACYQIRNNLGKLLTPIIIVTGTHTEKDLVRSMQAGANDFIRKPYNPIELLAKINAAGNQKRITDQLDTAESLLFALARMVEAKDEGTSEHCSRLSHIATVFGQKLGLPNEDIQALQRGGVLHDIGKLGIPDNILLKKKNLTEDEWNIMRQHPIIGERLCTGLKSVQSTLPIIRSHHEKLDGSGYPDGLKGNEIPLLAQIFQIVDIFDALLHRRSYKEAFNFENIINIFMQEVDKGWRDPVLVNSFLDIVKYEPQSLALKNIINEEEGENIFSTIYDTGVLQWDRKETA